MRRKSWRSWGSTADEASRMEDYARILDYLPQGHPDQSKFHREPLAYALGVDEFKLFELVPKEGAALGIGQRVYIGKEIDQRTEVLHVKRRVGHEELTTAAQKELPFVIQETVKEKEAKVVDFFNRAQAITTRLHMLELLPGLGKKTMCARLQEREKERVGGKPRPHITDKLGLITRTFPPLVWDSRHRLFHVQSEVAILDEHYLVFQHIDQLSCAFIPGVHWEVDQ